MNELAAVVRFLHLTAAVLLCGSFGFALLIARPALEKARMGADDRNVPGRRLHRQIVIWSLFALSVSALFGLWIQIVNVSDPAPRTFFERLAAASLLTDTQYGKVWLFRMVVFMGLSAMLFFAEKNHLKDDSSILLAGGLGLSACSLASISLSGHAATADGAALAMQILADALHLLAAGVWLGGLVPLFAFLRLCNQTTRLGASVAAQEATRRYSRLGLVCVAVLIATGSYNAWILVGGLPPLFGTPYGRLLLIKLGLLLPLLGVAATNLLRLKPKIISASPDGPEPKSALVEKLTRNVLIEACVGALILYIVGHMAVTPPARHVQPEWPFSFRWDWSALNKAPKLRAEVGRGMVWAAVGGVAIVSAALRRRRRAVSITIALGALGYAGDIIHAAVSIDAYPATYKRPAVAYQAISVANGKFLYEEAGCVACHGAAGYGDGPAAEGFNPKPADLTAPHANTHTAGDLFWWLSNGVKQSSGMPGFNQSLSEEERWDLINFMRALSSGERARSLAPVIDDAPWLVAPDFIYATSNGEAKALKDHRGDKIVLLVLLDPRNTATRLAQLAGAAAQLKAAGVEMITVPHDIEQIDRRGAMPLPVVTEGNKEISETYALFARSFADEKPVTEPKHMEFLVDKQGYIRARWLPAENDAWRKIDLLLKQVELLRNEKPRAPAPDDHVH